MNEENTRSKLFELVASHVVVMALVVLFYAYLGSVVTSRLHRDEGVTGNVIVFDTAKPRACEVTEYGTP